MHKNATKYNKTQSKWCINKHGASKIIDTFETYHYHGIPCHDMTGGCCLCSPQKRTGRSAKAKNERDVKEMKGGESRTTCVTAVVHRGDQVGLGGQDPSGRQAKSNRFRWTFFG
jgi:hypothetical protein